MADRSLLDLTSESDDRPVVRIDEIGYPLRGAGDLTLHDFKYLERVCPRVGALLQRATLTKSEAKELAGRLRELATVALDAPAAVLARLTDIQRVLVFKVFTELLTPGLVMATRAITAPPTGAPSRGTRPSRGSSGSMAATSTRGSRGRRSGRSARS
jgi:hypothetical protein